MIPRTASNRCGGAQLGIQQVGVEEARRVRDILCYIGSSRPAWTTEDPVSKDRKEGRNDQERREGNKEEKSPLNLEVWIQGDSHLGALSPQPVLLYHFLSA